MTATQSSTSTTRNRSATSRRATCEQRDFPSSKLQRAPRRLRLIEQHRPPVVLLDVQLPDIDGYDVCRYVKQKWPEVMVLMTSATFTTSEQRTPRPRLRRRQLIWCSRPSRSSWRPRSTRCCGFGAPRINSAHLNETLESQVKGADRRAVQRDHGAQGERRSHAHVVQTTYIFQGYMMPDGAMLDANRALLEANRKPAERRRRQAVLGHRLVYRHARDARNRSARRSASPRRGMTSAARHCRPSAERRAHLRSIAAPGPQPKRRGVGHHPRGRGDDAACQGGRGAAAIA